MSEIGKKNCWWLAQQAGHATPGAVQRLVSSAVWCPDRLRDVLVGVVAKLAAPGGVLVVDETGFAKKGTHSAGVARQYSGTLGKVDNCQVGVFVVYTVGRLRLLIDRVLYFPRVWIDDRSPRLQAGVSDAITFDTKPRLALAMISRVIEAGIHPGWVTADAVYGRAGYFRTQLRLLGLAYVVAVPAGQRIRQGGQPTRVDVAAHRLASGIWQRLSCGQGSKGPRFYDWAWVSIDSDDEQGEYSLLIRRSSDGMCAYYLVWHPESATLAEVITAAGSRWSIEEAFQISKDAFGLDHYQVRSHTGWYRHITLAMLAHALVALAVDGQKAYDDTDPEAMAGGQRSLEVTVNEIRYLIAVIVLTPLWVSGTFHAACDHYLRWSQWRQDHQRRSKASHYRHQLAINNC